MLNVVALNGRLTEKPQLKRTASDVPYIHFSVAIEKPWRKDHPQETEFIDCSAWRHTAEFICRNFQKGQMIGIDGSLHVCQWETVGGERRSKMEVTVGNAHFAGGKPQQQTSTQEDHFMYDVYDNPPNTAER